MNNFDDSIFSENRLSFGHLLARSEELSIWKRKPCAVRLTTYRDEAPIIYATAQNLLGNVQITEKWGKVGRHDDWLTVEAGVWYENSRFKHRGQRMRLIDVCKMLVGKTKAIGNTDIPTAQGFSPNTGWEFNLVTCLRLDVDMEQSWRRRSLDAVAQQIRTERNCARSLGLPYRCFRTGGKGHQIVIPLPIPTPHLLAWWWLTAFKTLLESSLHPDATLDKDNLTSLLRLPGGLHQDQTRLALWINPDTMRLHDIETQARMMGGGFRYPEEDDMAHIPPCEFHGAGKDVLTALAGRGHDKHQVPGPDRQDLFFGVVEDLPVNTVVCVFLHALNMASSEESATEPNDAGATTELQAKDIATFSEAMQNGAGFDLEWAKRVVQEEFVSGEFWDWLNMEGKRGILALWLVYGKDAEKEAIAIANRVSCRSEAERRKRIRTIKSYWKHFEIKDGSGATTRTRRASANVPGSPQVIEGDLTPESVVLVASLGHALQVTGKVQTRNLDALVSAIHVIILVMQQSTNGHIQVSAQMLAVSLNQRWPETAVTRKDADRMLSWLSLDDAEKYPGGEAPSKNRPTCKFALLQVVRDQFRLKYGGQIVANEYRPGPALIGTPLAEELRAKRREYRRQFICETDVD